jgi:membrane protein implicated in regulation of membrane protease activity
MLIFALVLAVIGLAALVTAVVTSNALIAWVCIGASVIGVLLLIVDAVRERSRSDDTAEESEHDEGITVVEPAEDYPDEPATEVTEVTEAEPEDTVAVSTDDADADTTKHD